MIKIFGVGDEQDTEEVTELGYQDDESPQQSEEEVGQIALDILDNGDSIFIVAPIAGIELEDIDVYLSDATLTLRGSRNKPEELYNPTTKIKNSECFWGKFVRNIILPENLDFAKIQAVMENNLLIISIPKLRFNSQNIKINKIED